MPVADFSQGLEINVADLREMIQQVVFAASTDDARPVLTGRTDERERRPGDDGGGGWFSAFCPERAAIWTSGAPDQRGDAGQRAGAGHR